MAYSSYSPFKPIRSFTSSKSMGGVNQAPLTSPSLYLPRFVIKTCISIKITSLSLKIDIKKAAVFYLLIHKIDLLIPTALPFGSPFFCRTRSEERRVGKECRSQWAREGYRKKEAEMGRGAWERQSE